jgi:hypothetical protein
MVQTCRRHTIFPPEPRFPRNQLCGRRLVRATFNQEIEMTSQNQDKPGQQKPGQQNQNPSQKPGQQQGGHQQGGQKPGQQQQNPGR